MHIVTQDIIGTLSHHKNFDNAISMSQYMKNKFPFYGIKTPDRKLFIRDIHKKNKELIAQDYEEISFELYNFPERELHYCALELLEKNINNFKINDIEIFEKLIILNSWWDTVDLIATRIVGEHFKRYPELIPTYIEKWLNSNNLWLNRVCILFQLKYKEKTDLSLLEKAIIKYSDSNEFFHQKAIGWALREYAKTDPEFVKNFVLTHSLKPLSKREALKNIKML